MKIIPKHIPIVLLLVLMSCASNVRTKKYTNDDFSKFKTFAYLPNTGYNVEDFNSDLDKSIEASLIKVINNKMIQNGFSVDKDNPDLLVLLTTSNDIESNLNNQNKK